MLPINIFDYVLFWRVPFIRELFYNSKPTYLGARIHPDIYISLCGFLYAFVCGIPICAVLAKLLTAARADPASFKNRAAQSVTLFLFGAIALFYMAAAYDVLYGPDVSANGMRGAGFVVYAAGACMEITSLCKELQYEPPGLDSATLASACLFALAALVDNMAVSALFLPFIIFRRIAACVSHVPGPEEQALTDKINDLDDRIWDIEYELEKKRGEVGTAGNRDGSIRLLPDIPDADIIAQLRDFGIIPPD